MKNLFELLTEHKSNGYDFKELLEQYGLINNLSNDERHTTDLFGNLYAIYQPAEAKKAVLYILYTYYVKSPLLLEKEPLRYTKQRAAEKVGLTEEQVRELVNFEYTYTAKPTKRRATQAEVDEIEPSDATQEMVAQEYNVEKIITCIQAYLKYQDEPEATHLLYLKDLYDQARVTSHRMIKKGNDVDFDTKIKIMEYAERLMKNIREWEDNLAIKNANQKPLREEIHEVSRKINGNSVRIEHVI